MKEIIKKIIIAVLVVVVVGVVASSLIGGDEPEVTESTTSSAQGQPPVSADVNATTGNQGTVEPSQQNPVNPQDTTASQPSQGITSGSDTSSQGTTTSQPSQGTTSQPSQGTTSGAYTPSQGTTTSQPQQGATSNSYDPTTTSQNVPQDPQSTTAPSQTQPTQAPQPANKIDAYQQIFKSGKFLMKVNDPDLGDVTMAMSGNKMFVEASMEGITLKMLYDGDKPDKDNPESGTWYIIIDKIKKYSPMPANMLGDMNVEDITKGFTNSDSSTVYVKSVETINGEQLDCESCTDTNGNTTKYYFRGDRLVRSDSISPSGQVSTTEFREINGNVDDSIFTIPDGYAKWDISGLLGAMV